MTVHRFMSDQEYRALIGGKVLRNSTDHRKQNCCRTTSVGFCFFAEEPDESVHWLSGCVDLDWCVTLEVPDGYLVPSWGTYIDNEGIDLSRPMNYEELMRTAKFKRRSEYCRSVYSMRDVQIIAATDKYYTMYPSRSASNELIMAMLRAREYKTTSYDTERMVRQSRPKRFSAWHHQRFMAMKNDILKKDPVISIINPAAIPRVKQYVPKEEADEMWRKKMEYQRTHPK